MLIERRRTDGQVSQMRDTGIALGKNIEAKT